MRKKVVFLLSTVALLVLLMPACLVPVTPTPVPVAATWVLKVGVSDVIPEVVEPQPGGGDLRLRWRNYSSTGDFVGTSVNAMRVVRPATALATPAAGTNTADGLWTVRATYKPGTPEQRSGTFVFQFTFAFDAGVGSSTLKGDWRIIGGTQDFANLSGQGTWLQSAANTYSYTGQISFGPK
ncbi:MAG: DUF3224 domain-containing protein [Chloroflexi bacterium]|nr:DUF3224 domain-containing protein [Chloroflexota bacterium]